MKYLIFILIPLLSLLVGCQTTNTSHALTPLEIQELQSRSFEAPKEVVFRSAVSVFQDLGYTIQNADLNTGMISAEGRTEQTSGFFDAMAGQTRMGQTRATAFVEQIGDRAAVRLNFVEINETSSAYGQRTRSDTAILSSEVYQNAFERIENAIFVRM